MTEVLVESSTVEQTALEETFRSNGYTYTEAHSHIDDEAVEHLTPRSRTPQPKAMNRTDSMLVELEYAFRTHSVLVTRTESKPQIP